MKALKLTLFILLLPITLPIWLILKLFVCCFDRNRPTYNTKRELKKIDNMPDGYEFERYFANLIKRRGYHEVELTAASGDYGADVLATKGDTRYAFQCKCYAKPVGNQAVQEVESGRQYYHCDIGVVVTNITFTKSAVALAEETGTLLWGREELTTLIGSRHRTLSAFDRLPQSQQVSLLAEAIDLALSQGCITVKQLKAELCLRKRDAALLFSRLEQDGLIDANGKALVTEEAFYAQKPPFSLS